MIHKYEPADKYVIYNDSKHLKPIVLELPSPPDIKKIDGYSKDPLEQYWRPLEVPQKLEILKETCIDKVQKWANQRQDRRVTEYRVSLEFWREIEEHKSFYEEEIAYIKKIHYYLYYGYWFFNKGKPTWIPPTYFRYLNFWFIPDDSLKGNRPEYRDVDRRTYIFKWFCYTTRQTLGNLDEKGHAKRDRKGRYEVIEKQNRTCFGHIKPKRRREGASNQECSDMLWTAERTPGANCVIMADTGKGAKDIYQDYMRVGFLNQPLFLKPTNEVYANSSSIDFVAPYHEYGARAINSKIMYVETASEGAVDRMKTSRILSDETGKVKQADARKRHSISKLTAAQFERIHGYLAYPSTVEEMEDGGESFRDIWDGSDFYRRDPLGHTMSGLYGLFTPAWDGMDGYIDKWGHSVIESPTQEQIDHAPIGSSFVSGKGAKEVILSKMHQFLTENTPKSLREYREYVRKHPTEIDHCWIGTAGDMGWDTIKLDKQMAEVSRSNSSLVRGNFEWIKGIVDNPDGVVFIEDKLNGRFFVSDLFLHRPQHINKITFTPGPTVWDEKRGLFVRAKMPLHPTIVTAGADQFDYGTAAEARSRIGGTRMSDGGIHLLLNYDETIDGARSKEEWETYKTIVSYRYRPRSLEEYCEDVIKVIVYYGAMLSLERNKTGLWEHIIDRGYGGYLIYMVNPDGSVEKKPGIWTGQGLGNKDNSLNLVRDYIEYRIHKDVHLQLLQEMKDIAGPEKLKDYDLLTAFMCSLIGAEKGFQGRFTRINADRSISLKGTSFAPHRI